MLLQKTINKDSKQIRSKVEIPQQSMGLMSWPTKTSQPNLNAPSRLHSNSRHQPKSLNDYFQQKNPNQFISQSLSDQQQIDQTRVKPAKYVQQLVTKEQLDKIKQLLQNVSIMKNHEGHFFEEDIRSISRQCGIIRRKVRQIKKQFLKDPTLSNLYYKAQLRKKRHDNFMRLLNYYIDISIKKSPHLSMEELVNEVRKKIPIKYKKQVKLPVVQHVVSQKQTNAMIGVQSPGFQLLSFNSKNTINVLQSCKSILRILDLNKSVYFLGTDIIATEKQAVVDGQQRKIILRGVIGSNMQAFWDIFIGASDFPQQNRSLLNLLNIIKKKNQQEQIHLAMSRQFMDVYKETLRSVSSLGFIFVEFGEKAKFCNPLKYWFKDLKELANKYDIKTRMKFQESFQHVCCLLDRKNYSVYFNTCIKQMRTIVEDSEQQNPLNSIN